MDGRREEVCGRKRQSTRLEEEGRKKERGGGGQRGALVRGRHMVERERERERRESKGRLMVERDSW